MPPSATSADVDERQGWSRHCNAGNFDLCEQMKFKCSNGRHATEGETAAQRADRLRAEARAATGSGMTPSQAAARSAIDEGPKPARPASRELRGTVLAALLREDGDVEHSGGRASFVLLQASGYEAGGNAFTTLLGAMERDGLIERDTRGTKTFKISITDAGEKLAGELGLAPIAAAPAPPAQEPARKLELVDDAPPVVATPKPIRSREGGRAGAAPSTTPANFRDPKVEIVFEDPPKRQNGRRSIDEVLDQEGALDALRSRPNEWARLITYGGGGGASGAVKKLRTVDALADFEFLAKRPPRSTSSDVAGSILYGRYVGGDQ